MTSESSSSSSSDVVVLERIPLTNILNNDENELVQYCNYVAIVTINRPDALNCFNTRVCDALCRIFSDLANESRDGDDDDGSSSSNGKLACVILTGKGRAFCVGADLSNPPDPLIQSSDLWEDLGQNPIYFMDQVQVPIIGAINGYCITGGFELALACDVLIGDSTTKFKDTHVKFGLAPCWGLSQKLQRRIGPGRAKWVSFSAVTIPALQALEWGLLNEVVPEERMLIGRAVEMATTIAKNNRSMVKRYKRAIDEGGSMDLRHGLQRERELGIAHYLKTFHGAKQNAKGFITDQNRPRSKL